MDIIEKLVALAQVSGSVNVKCQFKGDWWLSHEQADNQGVVHIVTKGSGYLRWAGSDAVWPVKAGDVIFFPKAAAHSLSCRMEKVAQPMPLENYQQGAFEVKQNTPMVEPDVSLFCACFRYDVKSTLIESLPEMMLLPLSPDQLRSLVNLLQFEAENAPLASKSVVNALASVLLILILRAYLAQADQTVNGFLKGWQDKRLATLLQAILHSPEADWSVEAMAHFAHLSRSQLIRLFQQYLAVSPHAFLHKIRLQRAALLLNQTSDSVLSIALSCGFQSETHFGKAFKKIYGVTPSVYRKAKLYFAPDFK